ncbi:lysylphosphatidylglycerol synthase domain-containing protein [Lyngbya confervoides]|uniref:Lysylphosphatidylglycerol synthase domain-containing protein n=1 Tax=Lyngbya confervoides BDU141951 TaxID=1574623 RepID=A0ABD4T4M6_9CYAN|nr:lysylphosphatidylglycerol synthase domain-containing protein [Lyngbya confervoides]MCM1983482.1 lysylphosphatidylglycerol synthase domain-containing protein [Lyngbya confervoides BDU141951]
MMSPTVPALWTRSLKLAIACLTLVFLGKTALSHGQELRHLAFQPHASFFLLGAIALLLGSEAVAATLWHWILGRLDQAIPLSWSFTTFFKTTLARYVPGNVWHLVGRVHSAREHGVSLDKVGLSVILEPLFMIAGGLVISLLCLRFPGLQSLSLLFCLGLLHPWGIHQLFRLIQWAKANTRIPVSAPLQTRHYPLREIAGGSVFMLLRGIAFYLTLQALHPMDWEAMPSCISGFSLAWLLSIVLPAPGGIGVFESAAIEVLQDLATPGVLLSAVVLYRVLCLASEVLGVGLILGAPVLKDLGTISWSQRRLENPIHHSLKAIAIPVLSSGFRDSANS